LLAEGATQASTQNVSAINSSHGEREGEAPTALLAEGATQAPVMEARSFLLNAFLTIKPLHKRKFKKRLSLVKYKLFW
jgi:hypothetical protein